MAPSSEVLRTCTLSLSKLQRLFCSSKTFAQTTFKGCDQKHTCRGKPAFGNKCCSNSVQNYSICSNKCKTIQNSGFIKSPILYPPQHKQPLSTQGPPSARWILSTQMFSVLITQSVRMLTATCRLFPWVNHFNMDLLNICILALYLHFCDVISHYFYFFNHFPADGQFRQKNVGRISHLYKTTVFTFFRKETNDITKVFKKLTCVELTKTITQPTTSLVQVASISFVQTAGEITQIKQAEISNIYIKNTYIRL